MLHRGDIRALHGDALADSSELPFHNAMIQGGSVVTSLTVCQEAEPTVETKARDRHTRDNHMTVTIKLKTKSALAHRRLLCG